MFTDTLTSWEVVASALLVEARCRAGINQAELARAAGVPRSLVSMYEGARREPGTVGLERLLLAAGFELGLRRPARALDDERSGRILAQVIDFAETFPYRSRGLRFPPFRSRIR